MLTRRHAVSWACQFFTKYVGTFCFVKLLKTCNTGLRECDDAVQVQKTRVKAVNTITFTPGGLGGRPSPRTESTNVFL